MDLTVHELGPSAGVVVLAGRLDATTVGDVRAPLHALLRAGTGDFVLDVSGTDVGDATGLGLIVGLHRGAERHDRHLVLQGTPPRLMRMLRATRLHRILRITSVVGDASTRPALTGTPAEVTTADQLIEVEPAPATAGDVAVAAAC